MAEKPVASPARSSHDEEVTRATWQPRPDDAETLRRFFGQDGRLLTIPSKHVKKLVVLNQLAQSFELGKVYSEGEVNEILRGFHDDVAALRRYLYEEGFMMREGGFYWRDGGSVEI
jgi:hypothetical protein